MPAATSPLTWDAPLDGGSPLNGYRVLVFEGTSLVATLEPDTPSCVVEHSATVVRQALVQAWNDQGYGPGVQVQIPVKAETDSGTGGGGTDPGTDPGTGGGGTTPTPGADGLTVTRSGSGLRFAIVDSRAGTLRYGGYTLYARTPSDVSANAYGTEYGSYTKAQFPLTLPADSFTMAGSGYTSWGAYALHTDQPRDVIFYADAPSDAAAPGGGGGTTPAPLVAPTIAATRNEHVITVSQTAAGSGFTDSILYRDGQPWNQPANLPFTETNDSAHTYFVRVSTTSGSADSNTVTVTAYTAPTTPPPSTGASFSGTSTTYTFDTDGDLAYFQGIDSTLSRDSGRLLATPSTDTADSSAGLAGYGAVILTANDSSGQRRLDYVPGSGGNGGGPIWNYQDQNNFTGIDNGAVVRRSGGTFVQQGAALQGSGPYSVEVDPDGTARVYDSSGTQRWSGQHSPGRLGVWMPVFSVDALTYTASAPTAVYRAGLIETAKLITPGTAYTYETTGKTPVAEEEQAYATSGSGRTGLRNAWFKFQLTQASDVQISGNPADIGFTGQNPTTFTDNAAYLFSAASGDVTNAQLPSALLFIAYDDDSSNNSQPRFLRNLQPGWYYISIGLYNGSSTVADQRLAFKATP